MDKIKTVKIKNEDGSVSEESYTISVDAKNVDMDNGKELQETIGTIDIDTDGNIAEQLENLNDNVDNLNVDIKKKAYFFDTIADMKNANLKAGDYVCTLGYYEVNDGGAAEYQIVSGNYIDDGGSYHKIKNNLYAELIIKDTVNVKQFGIFSSLSDNYTQLNVLLNTQKINNIFVPEGIYYISNNILIQNTNLTIKSNGATIKIDSYKNGGSTYAFRISNSEYITIDGLNFDTIADQIGTPPSGHTFENNQNFSNRNAIEIYNSKYITLNNIIFNKFNTDIFMSAYSANLGRNRNDYITIKNITSYLSAMPVLMSYSAHVLIDNYYADTKLETGFGQHDIYCSMLNNDITLKNLHFINDKYFGNAINTLNAGNTSYEHRNYNFYVENVRGQISELTTLNKTDATFKNINVTINEVPEGQSARFLIRITAYSNETENTPYSYSYFQDIVTKGGETGYGIFTSNTIGSSEIPNHLITINNIKNENNKGFVVDNVGTSFTIDIINSFFYRTHITSGSQSTINYKNCLFQNPERTYFIAVRSGNSTINLINNTFIATGLSMTQAVYNTASSLLINGWGNNCYNITSFTNMSSGINKNNNTY